jgi:hypothetical protein
MDKELYILWTNDNVITAEKMVFMYGHNAKIRGWWDEVTIIIWGATAKLAGENPAIQEKITAMIKDGVKVSACRACAEQMGVAETLESLGIEVKFWGEPLTELLKQNKKLITV